MPEARPAAKPVSKAQQQSHNAGHVRFVDSDVEEAPPAEPANHRGHATHGAASHPPAQHQPAANDSEDGYNAQPWDYSRQQERRQKRAGQRHTASVISLPPPPKQVVLVNQANQRHVPHLSCLPVILLPPVLRVQPPAHSSWLVTSAVCRRTTGRGRCPW